MTFSSSSEIGLPGFFLSYSAPPLASAVLYAASVSIFDGEHQERRIAAARPAPALLQSGENAFVQIALALDDRVGVRARLAAGRQT